MKKIEAGDKFYYVPHDRRYMSQACNVVITNVGRRWASLRNIDAEYDMQTCLDLSDDKGHVRITKGQYAESIEGELFASKHEFDSIQTKLAILSKIARSLQYGGQHGRAKMLALSCIKKACELLEVDIEDIEIALEEVTA